MSVKILANTIIGLEQFSQNPRRAIIQAEEGIVAVFENNAPMMYALTPERLAALLTAEETLRRQADISLEGQFFDEPLSVIRAPAGKFPLYSGWQPDADFLRQAALWGITLTEPVTAEELAAFIAYWQAEGRAFHQIQWQQKLARHLQISRGTSSASFRRDITQPDEPDQQIPNGFRGE